MNPLCQVWLNWPISFWGFFFNFGPFVLVQISKFCQGIFDISLLSYLGKGSGFWFEQIPLRPRMLCARFGWNWLSGSGEDFLTGSGPLFERTYWLVVLEKKIFKSCQFIFTISQLSPLGKGSGPLFEQTWNYFHQVCFVRATFGWNWPSGSGEEDETVKSLQISTNDMRS